MSRGDIFLLSYTIFASVNFVTAVFLVSWRWFWFH